MVEIVFVVVALSSIVFLFSAHPFRRRELKPWLNVAAILVFAIPGVITLVTSVRPFLATSGFEEGESFAVPQGDIVDVEAATAFLVRAFVLAPGGERRPIDAQWTVVRRGDAFKFAMPDGSNLTAQLTVGPSRQAGANAIMIDSEWRAHTSYRSSAGPAVAAGIGFDGGDRPIFVNNVDNLQLDSAPIGSLLGDRNRNTEVRLYVTPLPSAECVERVDAVTWWSANADRISARLVDDGELATFTEGGYGSSFSIGKGEVTFSGALLLLLSLLMMLAFCRHWLRVCCVFLLASILYVGAVDRVVLRIHVKALTLGDETTQAAAVTAIAGSRLHTLEAARRLVEIAENRAERPLVRETAIGMLGTRSMAKALWSDDDRGQRLRRWKGGEDEALRDLATRIEEQMTPVKREERGTAPVHRPSKKRAPQRPSKPEPDRRPG